jgi:hypothetical protein
MAFRITSYISPRYQVPTDSLLRSRSRSRLRSSLDGITTTPVEGRCALQANAMPCMGLGEPYSQCLQREPPRPSTAGTRRILDKPDHSSLASSSRCESFLKSSIALKPREKRISEDGRRLSPGFVSACHSTRPQVDHCHSTASTRTGASSNMNKIMLLCRCC